MNETGFIFGENREGFYLLDEYLEEVEDEEALFVLFELLFSATEHKEDRKEFNFSMRVLQFVFNKYSAAFIPSYGRNHFAYQFDYSGELRGRICFLDLVGS